MESELSNETVENSDQLEKISSDLKSILQLLTEERELRLQEKQVQEKILLEENEAQKLLEKEQEEQALLDQQEALENEKIQQEKEQLLIDSENEYRKTVLDSVNAQNQKMDTYIQNTDGLLKSFELMNANTELLIENTAVEDNAEQDNMSFYADSTLVMIVWVFLPLYIAYRLIKPFFNKIF